MDAAVHRVVNDKQKKNIKPYCGFVNMFCHKSVPNMPDHGSVSDFAQCVALNGDFSVWNDCKCGHESIIGQTDSKFIEQIQ